MKKKTDFDQYVAEMIKKHPSLKEGLKKADRAWDIAGQVYDLRKKAGLTQKDLADLMGTKQSNIARIESADYTSYTHKTLEKIAKVLNARLEVKIVPTDSDQQVSVLHRIK